MSDQGSNQEMNSPMTPIQQHKILKLPEVRKPKKLPFVVNDNHQQNLISFFDAANLDARQPNEPIRLF